MICLYEMIVLACFILLVLNFSSRATYQFKMIAFLFGSAMISLISLPFMIFRPRGYRNGLFPAFGCRLLGRAIGVTAEVRGLENVRKDHGSVVLINHQSFFDLLPVTYLWPLIGRATIVCKKEILYYPFFGVCTWMFGTLYIDKSKTADAIEILNKESKAINERNCKLLVFPEGTRHQGDTLLPFKKGPFHIAIQSRCPIQPVVVSQYSFFNNEKKIFKPGHIIIHILPEISTEGYTSENIDKLVKHTRDIMQEEYAEISKEAKLLNLNKVV